jgi:hypothetical protein
MQGVQNVYEDVPIWDRYFPADMFKLKSIGKVAGDLFAAHRLITAANEQ